ncbi:carboxypeptidase-like regulatory domain-containing protein [Fluviicola sp.]|uniref:carboxypeptidase-like regulatory domain-containing protein n=1 Tax=Fluviicola sp. TaxID=1917219 RepID=UPI0031E25F4A
MKCSVLIFCLLLAGSWFAQTSEIQGKILDQEGKNDIPFATIYNRSLKKGTIGNVDGFFKIPVGKLSDTIVVTAVGYKTTTISLKENTTFYQVRMSENIVELSEVTVKPSDNTYLYELIGKCRQRPNKIREEAKAYYELKTFIDNRQVELVEGFYNAKISGYELKGQQLKAGRLAMKQYDDQSRMFVSVESSKAILLSEVTEESPYFPANPFSLNAKRLRKSFYLDMDRKYLDDQGDSMMIVSYFPKVKDGNYYRGKIWINCSKMVIQKLQMECTDCKTHPFLPLFRTDSITGVDLQVTKTFVPRKDKQVFAHVDFNYSIAFRSRFGMNGDQSYRIRTNALFFAYDYDQTFFIPRFEFNRHATDYRKILSMPYNDFFWQNNDEYRLNDSKNSNQIFFMDSLSVTNLNIRTTKRSPIKKNFYKEPYVKWSVNRVIFKESIPDSLLNNFSRVSMDKSFNLAVQVFFDRNSYRDSTDILTCAIFDPYESYYLLPIDQNTHCFINIYFDLIEMERRKLDAKLKSKSWTLEEAEGIYNRFLTDCTALKEKYYRSVDHGRNLAELIKWNRLVKNALKIDNMALFGISEK